MAVVAHPPQVADMRSEIAALQRVLQDWREKRCQLQRSFGRLMSLLDCQCPAGQASPRSAEPRRTQLVVMTLNLQYYASFPDDLAAAHKKLREALGGTSPPDVICVQEGLATRNVLRDVGYDLIVCAGERGVAQSVREMVYSDETALGGCKEESHDQLLCNQFYIRRGCSWFVVDTGAKQISSRLDLAGGGNRVCSPLAVRSMLWLKLRKSRTSGASVYIMCTHITGGRFEDQYFVQQLVDERRRQLERCDTFFKEDRLDPHPDDLGLLVGDFNATETYTADGPMHGYFKTGIANSPGVREDAEAAGIMTEAELEERFKAYMTSPFRALRARGWMFAYGDEVGITSAFGHLIDHMALSRSVPVERVEVVHLTNQKFSKKDPDTDVVITDHNAVKVTLSV